MNGKTSNICTRCGRDRVESKSWTEQVDTFFGKSTIVHTENVCPDPDCQKVVEEGLARQKQKTEELHQAREERMKKAKFARKPSAE